jgi:hypothetical protein
MWKCPICNANDKKCRSKDIVFGSDVQVDHDGTLYSATVRKIRLTADGSPEYRIKYENIKTEKWLPLLKIKLVEE